MTEPMLGRPTAAAAAAAAAADVPMAAPTTGGSGPQLRAHGVRLAYDDRVIVDHLDFDVPRGKVTVVVGANACGKSTLLRALGRLLAPKAGAVLLDGQVISSLPSKVVARQLGLLPQSPSAPEGLTVSDLVSRGRTPHQSWWQQWSAVDEQAVTAAMSATRTLDLADRAVDELSGGQRQRAWIAMALAQGTELLLLDEPTTYLDLAHQVDVLDLVAELNTREGRTVVMVLHDLNQACRYAQHIVAMREGRMVAAGPPAEVVTEGLVREVFELDCRVVTDPVAGTPLVIPIGRHHPAGGAPREPLTDPSQET